MPIVLTGSDLRAIFPRAPQAVLDAFRDKQAVLTKAGINASARRLSYFFANIEHECGGFTIPNLTENINYTAERMAAVWPKRFSSGDQVRATFGTDFGWQKKAFDQIYGNRMGNRPGTHDGSTYIGRGGPQWTGREGYEECEKRTGLPAVSNPSIICQPQYQPEVCAAFWTWKNLNKFADVGDFTGCVKVWNGGTNGLADRLHLMAGNDPIISRLKTSDKIVSTIQPSAPLPDVAPIDAKPANSPISKTDKAIVGGASVAVASAIWQWGWIAAGIVAALGIAAFIYFKFVRK